MLDEIAKKFPAVEPEPEQEKPKKKSKEVKIPTVKERFKETITIEEFDKMQLQMGEIISCEEVKDSKKLLCSQVKISGDRVLQIVSGIKNYYTPEQMVGKKVVVITNLKPAKLAGILSEGMLLCAEDFDGNLALLSAEKDMPAGAMIS
jgi:methionyl-tRNA synthetase